MLCGKQAGDQLILCVVQPSLRSLLLTCQCPWLLVLLALCSPRLLSLSFGWNFSPEAPPVGAGRVCQRSSSGTARCLVAGSAAVPHGAGGGQPARRVSWGDGYGSLRGSPCVSDENVAASLSAKRPCASGWYEGNSEWSQDGACSNPVDKDDELRPRA